MNSPNDPVALLKDRLCESFNKLAWHDSKLRGAHVQHKNDIDEIVLDVEMRGLSEAGLTPAKVVFEDVAFVFCDLDLQGKRQGADDISSAKCYAESELKSKIQKDRLQFAPGALESYVHFNFYLVPPFGTIDIIAANFRVVVTAKGI
jgi:hypothetical protein